MTRSPHAVIFRFYAPAEGSLIVDAESNDHAKQLVGEMLKDRYKEAEIVDSYQIPTPQEDDFFGADGQTLDPYFQAKETKKQLN